MPKYKITRKKHPNKIIYAVTKDGDILSIIEAKTQKQAQAKLEALIAEDYMKKHGIKLLKMSTKRKR